MLRLIQSVFVIGFSFIFLCGPNNACAQQKTKPKLDVVALVIAKNLSKKEGSPVVGISQGTSVILQVSLTKGQFIGISEDTAVEIKDQNGNQLKQLEENPRQRDLYYRTEFDKSRKSCHVSFTNNGFPPANSNKIKLSGKIILFVGQETANHEASARIKPDSKIKVGDSSVTVEQFGPYVISSESKIKIAHHKQLEWIHDVIAIDKDGNEFKSRPGSVGSISLRKGGKRHFRSFIFDIKHDEIEKLKFVYFKDAETVTFPVEKEIGIGFPNK